MDRLLARLERYLGKFAVEHLTGILVAGMGIAYVLSRVRPEFTVALALDLDLVARGQVWRLVSYIFIPPETSPLWVIFSLYFLYLAGSNIEAEWGAFKFNAYYLIGMIGTTIAAAVTGGAVGNTYLNLSLWLTFGTLFPNFEILLFFVLPVRVKWLALLDALILGYTFVTSDMVARAAIAAALLNYLVFFGGHWWDMFQRRNLRVRQGARRAALGGANPKPLGTRECAICGAREADGADIRVCSCEKCAGKPRNLCLQHARNH